MKPNIGFLILIFSWINAVFRSDANFKDNFDQIYDVSGSEIKPDLDSLYLLPISSDLQEHIKNADKQTFKELIISLNSQNIGIQSEAFIFIQKLANFTPAQIQLLMEQGNILDTLNNYLREEQNPLIKLLIIKTLSGLVKETNVFEFIQKRRVFYNLVSILPNLDDSCLEESIKFVTKLAYYGDTYQRCTIFTLLYPHLDNFMANINDKIVYQTSLMIHELTNRGFKCYNIFFDEFYKNILEKLNDNLAKALQHQNPEIRKHSLISLTNIQNASAFYKMRAESLAYYQRKKLENENSSNFSFSGFLFFIALICFCLYICKTIIS